MVETFVTHITPYGLDRKVFVYLPDDWKTSGQRYPVLYMFDGHNLFFDSTATYGTCWGLKSFLDANPHWIVAAPECNHTGNQRLVEYCPYDTDWWGGLCGTGKQYLDWMVHEFKPAIDAAYPTLPGRESTAVGGSSMGGLMSLYAAVAYPAVFSRAACLSSSVRICMSNLVEDIRAARLRHDTRIYLSWGERENNAQPEELAEYTANALTLAHLLSEKGVAVWPYLQLEGTHCEADWAKQVPQFMAYLFPKTDDRGAGGGRRLARPHGV